MHLIDHVGHAGELLVVGVDHHINAVVEQFQVRIGHHRGNLDEGIVGQIQPRHLTVDPDQKITHPDSLVPVQPSARGPMVRLLPAVAMRAAGSPPVSRTEYSVRNLSGSSGER